MLCACTYYVQQLLQLDLELAEVCPDLLDAKGLAPVKARLTEVEGRPQKWATGVVVLTTLVNS